MRERLLIFLSLVVLVVVLVGINAASYVHTDKLRDIEGKPNRSTYNTGSTGTRALYDLLAETGRKPARWTDPPQALLTAGEGKAPAVFVVIGALRQDYTDEETQELLTWVSGGGRLVIIDRRPPENLIKTTSNWLIKIWTTEEPALSTDPSIQNQMTIGVEAAKPAQPTVFTSNVTAVQPSRFASSIMLEYAPDKKDIIAAPKKAGPHRNNGTPAPGPQGRNTAAVPEKPPPDVPRAVLFAPVAEMTNKDKVLLAAFPYGEGQIVFLSDPYVVSNAGLGLVDNAQLAVNMVSTGWNGTIAFDEFHQGYGPNTSRFVSYFSGTPLVAMSLQIAVLIGLILWSGGRRFARPLPAAGPNRLSKLEYVGAMAELQRRTKAYDLAIENIYGEFRRRVARLAGVDNFTTSRHDIAKLIAERVRLKTEEIETLMRDCENAAQGSDASKQEVLSLTSRLRELEAKLGIKRKGSQNRLR
jgi:Domain of unknown function (DUF4350)